MHPSIEILCTILLLFAAFKNEKPLLLLPWLVSDLIMSVFCVVDVIYTGARDIEAKFVDQGAVFIVFGLALGSTIAILILTTCLINHVTN